VADLPKIERYQGLIVKVGAQVVKAVNLPDWDLLYITYPEGKMDEYRTALTRGFGKIERVTKSRIYFMQ
jgi:hypothetical protein